MTRLSSRRLAFTSSSCACRNSCRSSSASCSSSASGLIGPMSRSSRSSSRAAAGERGARRHFGCGRVERRPPARRRTRCAGVSTAVSSRRRVSASSTSRRCRSSRTSSSSCSACARVRAQLLELIAGGRGALGLGPAGGAPTTEQLVDPLGELAQTLPDRGVARAPLFERDPVLLRLGPPLGVAREAVVDLGEPVLEHLAPLGELRGAERRGRDADAATVVARSSSSSCTRRARLEERLRFGGLGLERRAPAPRARRCPRRRRLAGLAARPARRRSRASSTSRCVRSACDAGTRRVRSRRARGPRAARLPRPRLRRRGGRSSSALAASSARAVRRRAASSDSSARGDGVVERGAAWRPGRRHRGATSRGRRSGRRRSRDDGERRLAEHEIEGARPVAVGEERTVEQPLDRGGEPRHRAAHAVGEEAGARARWAPAGAHAAAVPGDEQRDAPASPPASRASA